MISLNNHWIIEFEVLTAGRYLLGYVTACCLVQLVSCLVYPSNLMMMATCPSETSVDFHRATGLYVSEDRTLQSRSRSKEWIIPQEREHNFIFQNNSKHETGLHWIYLLDSSVSYRIFNIQYWMVHHLIQLIIIWLCIVGTILFDLCFGWSGLLSVCWPWWTCVPLPRQ
jgi:hypothetical protein